MKFIKIAAEDLTIVYQDSFGGIIESNFGAATISGAPVDSSGEQLEVQAYKTEEEGEHFTNVDSTQLIMVDEFSGEQSRFSMKEYLEGGVYYDPETLMGIAA